MYTISNRKQKIFFEYWYFLLFFLVGLENILLPPLEVHSWRQTLTIGMAQEYLNHPNIFYPRTVIGENTDILAAEFPFFSYLLTTLYWLFGFEDWYGRLLNWAVSCIGSVYFYKLVKRLWDKEVAIYSVLALMSSIVFMYARKSMPDTFSLFLNIIGIFYVFRYFDQKKLKWLIFGSILCTLGVLNKIPFVLMWIFLIFPILDKTNSIQNKAKVILTFLIGFSLVLLWYFVWVPHLLDTYGNQLFWIFSFEEGNQLFTKLFTKFLSNIFTGTFHNPLLTLLSIMGLGVSMTKENKVHQLFIVLFLSVFTFFVVKSGRVAPTHDYYMIPLTVIFTIGFGVLLKHLHLPSWLKMITCLLIVSHGFAFNKKASFNPKHNRYYLGLPAMVDKYIPKDARILVNGGAFNPFMMYWTGRKGWTYRNADFQKTKWMPDLINKGVTYVVQDKHLLIKKLPYKIIAETEDFIIYDPKE